MVWGILASIRQCQLLVLHQHRQLVAQPLLDRLLAVLPHQSVAPALGRQLQQRRPFVVGQPRKFLYLLPQRGSVYSCHKYI